MTRRRASGAKSRSRHGRRITHHGTHEPIGRIEQLAASFASTLRRAITIATFTLPLARSIAWRASSRETPHTSITMRSPRSWSFALNATRSTIRFP